MIYLTGDTHGDIDIQKLGSKFLLPKQKQMSKKDFVIILGDFGLLWEPETDGTEKYWINWLNEKNFTTLFIDGNHENFTRLNNLEQVPMFGSVVGKVSDSVFHLKRGNIYEIDGKRFLTIGGAESVDKCRRITGISWWPEELITYKEQEYIFDILNKNLIVDYVLTHTCPISVFDKLDGMSFKCEDPTMKVLQEVLDKLENFKHWYFGHFHLDQKINDHFTVVYNNIIKTLKG